jgi:hypothetical protein
LSRECSGPWRFACGLGRRDTPAERFECRTLVRLLTSLLKEVRNLDECFFDGAQLVSASTACCVLWLVASSKTAQQSFVQLVFFLCERDGWILAMERASHQRLTPATAVFTVQIFCQASVYESFCVCSTKGLVHRICRLSKCLGMARVCLRRGGSVLE